MAFDETIYLNLEGGIIQPITHVTANFSPSNVVVYDGETYRDDPTELLASDSINVINETYIGSAALVAAGVADPVSHTAPRYKGKQRTLWTFARTILGTAGYSHVCWSDEVISSGDFPAFRIGTATTVV